jgi:ATP-binding cassette, subfamily B, bacterial CvaB/MchF/RaxB
MLRINSVGHYQSSFWAREYCQLEEHDCGICCVAYLSRRVAKNKLSVVQLKSIYRYNGRPFNFREMIECGKAAGLDLSALKIEGEEQVDTDCLPAIYHLKNNHYVVVVSKIGNDRLEIFDPIKGLYVSDSDPILSEISGYFLVADAVKRNQFIPPGSTFGIKDIYEELKGHKKSFLLLGGVSLILQLISLAPIVISQRAIDSIGMPDANKTILYLLLFGAFMLSLDFFISGVKGVILNRFRLDLSIDSAHTLLTKVWKSSSSKLSTISTAKLIKDFDSIHTLRDILSNELISFVLSVSSLIISFCFLFYYHPFAALISFIGAAIYVVIKIFSISRFVFLESESHIANSNLYGAIFETLDQFSSIVSHPLESNRKSFLWATYCKKIVNEWSLNTFSLKFTLISIFIFGTITIAANALCFSSVIRDELSLGFAFAFFTLQQRFITSGSQCISGIQNLSVFRISIDRLFSFETLGSVSRTRSWQASEAVDYFDIHFSRYPVGKWQKLTGTLSYGDFLVLAGDSGSGKSTFLRDLLSTDSPLSMYFQYVWNPCKFGSKEPSICMVAQGDNLLSGTLLENIVFFSPEVDKELLSKCIEVCGLRNVIQRLNYGLSTPITFSSAPISGGEYQRILIARALYSKPDILIIDESTSDLDLNAEIELLSKIRDQVGALVVVSHKSEIQSMARKRLNIVKEPQ